MIKCTVCGNKLADMPELIAHMGTRHRISTASTNSTASTKYKKVREAYPQTTALAIGLPVAGLLFSTISAMGIVKTNNPEAGAGQVIMEGASESLAFWRRQIDYFKTVGVAGLGPIARGLVLDAPATAQWAGALTSAGMVTSMFLVERLYGDSSESAKYPLVQKWSLYMIPCAVIGFIGVKAALSVHDVDTPLIDDDSSQGGSK